MDNIFGQDAQDIYDLAQLIREHAMIVDRALEELAAVKNAMRERIDTVLKKWEDGGIDPASEYPEHVDPDMLSYHLLDNESTTDIPEQQECELPTDSHQ